MSDVWTMPAEARVKTPPPGVAPPDTPQAQPTPGDAWAMPEAAKPKTWTMPQAARVEPPEKGGFFDRMWQGITGGDVSKAGRVGMGMADPVYGAAQAGARGYLTAPEDPFPAEVPAEHRQSVDTQVKEREQQYEQGRKQFGQSGFDWNRLWGNVLSPANLAMGAVPSSAGAGIGTRLALGGMRGALGGAMQPVQDTEHYAGQKAKELAFGGALGAVAEPLLTMAPKPSQAGVEDLYRRSIRPTSQGIEGYTGLRSGLEEAGDAVTQIIRDKPNLRYGSAEEGMTGGHLPQSVEQFSEAIGQTKDRIFQQYDALARSADKASLGTTTEIPKVRGAFDQALRAESTAQKAVAAAEREVTQAAAQQSRAGENVYMSSAANAARRQAEQKLATARETLAKAREAKGPVVADLSRPWVDLRPIANDLQQFVHDPVVQTLDPGVGRFAQQQARRLAKQEAFSPMEAQNAIKHLNANLKAFYRNPTFDTASRAAVSAMVANRLRAGVDEMITRATGEAYQPLKTAYGSLRAIEKEVAHRAQMWGRQSPGGGLVSNLLDISTIGDLSHFLISAKASLGTAVAKQAVKRYWQWRRSPDQMVKRMFEQAERLQTPPTGIGRVLRAGQPAAAPAADVAGLAASRPAMQYSWPNQ